MYMYMPKCIKYTTTHPHDTLVPYGQWGPAASAPPGNVQPQPVFQGHLMVSGGALGVSSCTHTVRDSSICSRV